MLSDRSRRGLLLRQRKREETLSRRSLNSYPVRPFDGALWLGRKTPTRLNIRKRHRVCDMVIPSTPHPLFVLTKQEALLGEPMGENTISGHRVFRSERMALMATAMKLVVLGSLDSSPCKRCLRVPNGAITVVIRGTGPLQVLLSPSPLCDSYPITVVVLVLPNWSLAPFPRSHLPIRIQFPEGRVVHPGWLFPKGSSCLRHIQLP